MPGDSKPLRSSFFFLGGDPVVPNLRFGTTGPSKPYITVPPCSPNLRRYDWIPKASLLTLSTQKRGPSDSHAWSIPLYNSSSGTQRRPELGPEPTATYLCPKTPATANCGSCQPFGLAQPNTNPTSTAPAPTPHPARPDRIPPGRCLQLHGVFQRMADLRATSIPTTPGAPNLLTFRDQTAAVSAGCLDPPVRRVQGFSN